jgi:hypothetical protein
MIVKARAPLKAEAPAHWTKATKAVTAPKAEAVTAITRAKPTPEKAPERVVVVVDRGRTEADYRCLMDTKCRALVRDIENRARREARRHRTRRSMASVPGPQRKED